MTDIVYEDFSVWIEQGPEDPRARVTARCRAGEDSAFCEMPAELGRVSPALARLDLRRGLRHLDLSSPDSASGRTSLKPREVGDLLFKTIFSGPIRQLYDRVCGGYGEAGKGVRIRLHFDPSRSAGLCELPWELLYIAETKDYLGFDRRTPVVRYVELQRPNTVTPFRPPLRVLAAAANPPGTALLDLEKECELIRNALAGSAHEVVVVPRARPEVLRGMLRQGPFHVLHFMGHGVFDDAKGTGALLLESEDGYENIVSGEVLANHLKGCLPPLVVVNACESARTASGHGHDFFAGIASSLVMAGVPAVVAMRAPVTDRAAIAFSKALYQDLATGSPVDAAVAEGRLAIYGLDPTSFEWAVPVLFLRVADGQLFAREQEQEAAPSARRAAQPEDRIHISGDLRGVNVDIGNQRGPGGRESSSAFLEIEGNVTADGNLTIVNRKLA
jgi:hypothetical protein